MVDLVGSYQFDDQVTEGGDVFARDPYILRFRCLNTGEKRFLFEGFYMQNVSAQMWRSIWGFFCYLCVHLSAEGPGDDSSSHQTGGLGEGAGRALRRFPERHPEVGNRRKMETSPVE